MSNFEAVYLYDRNNQFVGAAIKKAGVLKLDSVNIWTQEEAANFKKTLDGLNDENELRQFWPDAHDPEVGELVENPDWEPLKLEEADVPDWDNSDIVEDEFGGIDGERSTVVYKKAMVPDPTEAQQRYYKAQEIVARRRLAEAR
jgi:hypothetical protein